MLFNSIVFFLFFAAFFAAYWALSRHTTQQNRLILIGSYVFYGWWDERFMVLIALSASVDYLCGLGVSGRKIQQRDYTKAVALIASASLAAFLPTIGASWPYMAMLFSITVVISLALFGASRLEEAARRKAYLIVSLAANLGLLASFKYFGFFAESLSEAVGALGFNLDLPLMQIILPIGISFYTFQTLSYTIDVYRKDMQPTDNLVSFAAYVAFFPQLVAGPIERARTLLPQFETPRVWSDDKAVSGGLLFLWGLYKKVAIADNLAPIVNAAFADPSASSPALMLLGVIAFAIQIYCDFSGYSDMARGLARLLGFELMLNFNLPYFARTPSEFWRRWHISLSTWLRDYLYVPLGGNRYGAFMTYRNLLITMLLGGLWHGAAWTFIAWGAFHGGILALYRFAGIDRRLDAMAPVTPFGIAAHVTAWALMAWLTLIGWALFRAGTIADAGEVIRLMHTALFNIDAFGTMARLPEWETLTFLAAPLLAAQLLNRFGADQIAQGLDRVAGLAHRGGALMNFARANAFIVLLVSVIALGAEGRQEFIYFDF